MARLSQMLCLLGALTVPGLGSAADIAPTEPADYTARGVLEARHTAEIAAPLSARLTSVPFRPGTTVPKGAVVARFDCTAMEAERSALESAHATLTIRAETQRELLALGAAGELDLRLAESEAAQAAAEAKALDARLKDCTIHAPWAARVVERHRQAFETPRVGEPILTLMRTGSSEIVILAPSAWAGWLEVGSALTFTLDETSETLDAEIIRLGAAVDPVSQTFEVAARPKGTMRARPGMSGTARFSAPARP